MKTLVLGGTGTVGSNVVAGLMSKGVDVLCMTRSEGNLKKLPGGVEGRLGDLEKPDSLSAAFKGAEALFLLIAVSQTETEQGLAAVEAAKSAGIGKIVYMSVPIPEESKHIPHFKSKIPIEEAVRKSGIAYTILKPNNFFQNDYWFQEAIMSYGVYPQPIGSKGQNRVDVRDIADAAVNALTTSSHDGREYSLHGPDSLTGEDVAAVFSRHFGREIKYGGDDLDAWSQQAKAMLPEWMVEDLRIMYQYFQNKGFNASEAELARQPEVLGHQPRSFDAFVAELGSAWK